jgi:spermidine dehydrogenase
MPCATAPCRFRARSIREVYDLVIVGGGLSGLSAAHFYHKAMGAGQKVLVLDNHDDFGGHAKRNEFVVNGKTIVCNGGTLNIESPGRYNPWARSVLKIGLDLARFRTANSANPPSLCRFRAGGRLPSTARRSARRPGARTWSCACPRTFLGLQPRRHRQGSDRRCGKGLLHRLTSNSPARLSRRPVGRPEEGLARPSFLPRIPDRKGRDRRGGYWFFQLMGCGTFCVGADATPALFGWVQGYPALRAWVWAKFPMACSPTFPAASTDARRKEMSTSPTATRPWPALIAKLVPGATDARSQEDLGLARFDYDVLDRPDNPTRIRLSSVVVHVEHRQSRRCRGSRRPLHERGQAQASAREGSVLASWNMMIPMSCPNCPPRKRKRWPMESRDRSSIPASR